MDNRVTQEKSPYRCMSAKQNEEYVAPKLKPGCKFSFMGGRVSSHERSNGNQSSARKPNAKVQSISLGSRKSELSVSEATSVELDCYSLASSYDAEVAKNHAGKSSSQA